MAVSPVRTSVTVQAAATSGLACRLEATRGYWYTTTRVYIGREVRG